MRSYGVEAGKSLSRSCAALLGYPAAAADPLQDGEGWGCYLHRGLRYLLPPLCSRSPFMPVSPIAAAALFAVV
jgi:hypothetical protein